MWRICEQQKGCSKRHAKVREELSLKDEWTLPGRQWDGTEVLVGKPDSAVLTCSIIPAANVLQNRSSFSTAYRSKSKFPSLTFRAFHHLAPEGLPGRTSTHPKCSAQWLSFIPKFLNAPVSSSLLMDPLPVTPSSLTRGNSSSRLYSQFQLIISPALVSLLDLVSAFSKTVNHILSWICMRNGISETASHLWIFPEKTGQFLLTCYSVNTALKSTTF